MFLPGGEIFYPAETGGLAVAHQHNERAAHGSAHANKSLYIKALGQQN